MFAALKRTSLFRHSESKVLWYQVKVNINKIWMNPFVGATTLSTMTLSITTMSVTTLSVTVTLSIKTHIIILCCVLHIFIVMLKCCNAECSFLSVIILSVVLLSVMAPFVDVKPKKLFILLNHFEFISF